MGSWPCGNDAFEAAWFWAIGARGFDDAGSAAAAAEPEVADPVPPQVIITVPLDELDGPSGSMLL